LKVMMLKDEVIKRYNPWDINCLIM
jgi:hypothetical protein